jgi:integrase
MAMTMLLRRMKVDATVHGFRSAFRDWAAECTGYSHEVCEMALAHVIGNKAEAAYRRGDLFEKRRQLMADWAKYCSSDRASHQRES